MEATLTEQKTFFKVLEEHIIKTIIAAIVIASLTGAGTAFGFYYNTNTDIKNLFDKDVEKTNAINNIEESISEINDKMGGTNLTTAVSEERMNGLESSFNDVKTNMVIIQKNQTDMMKLMLDIQRNQ